MRISNQAFAECEPEPITEIHPGWPEPQNLTDPLPPVPPFPVALLPAALRPWVEDISERMQCPPDFVAAPAIVALGSAVGRRVSIQPKAHDDWTEIPNIWGAVIGRPGLLKSPAVAEALRPLRRLEAEAAEVFEQKLIEHCTDGFLDEAQVEILKAEMKKAAKRGGEDGANQAKRAAKKLAEIEKRKQEPTCTRFIVNDPTIEKLGILLSENPMGLLYARDELTGLFALLNREGHEADRAFLLEGWNGQGAYTVDRVGRGTLRIPSTTLSVFGGIQPGPLSEYVSGTLRGGAGADGFLQRFQVVVWPDDPGQWRNVDRAPDTRARSNAADVYTRLSKLHLPHEQYEIPTVHFQPDAQEVFDTWRAELESRLRSDLPEAIESHLSKYRKLMPALALLLHLADAGVSQVSKSAAIRAAGLCEFFFAHATRLYEISGRAERYAARELARRIQRGDVPSPFTVRDVYRRGWRYLSSREIAARACSELEEAGWIRAETEETGGRPKTNYQINPRVEQVEEQKS